MSRGIRYTDEFKQEAVNQIVVHGYSVADVSERLGVSTKSLLKVFKPRMLALKRNSNALSKRGTF